MLFLRFRCCPESYLSFHGSQRSGGDAGAAVPDAGNAAGSPECPLFFAGAFNEAPEQRLANCAL
eukprot:12083969-Alexandrium_andersonii.AAC.1